MCWQSSSLLVTAIACNSINFRVESLIQTVCWHRSGFSSPRTGLQVLISCSMVRCSANDGTLSMHDQLRELAYSIVREEGDIAQRTRLRDVDAESALHHRVRAQRKQSFILLFSLPR